ncbi:MAG: aminodeoxychorismate lyase [Gammaproteobacteria bacterium]|nr:aminodeoxychorismate lyase [Gammaproteobacteria bacterium]
MVICSVNGVVAAAVPVSDRGLAYGDGVFETMRLVAGDLPLWAYHKQRLTRGCQRLGIVPSLEQVQAWLCELLAAVPAATLKTCTVAKLIVTRGVGGRGYRPDPGASPTVIIALYAGDLAAQDAIALRVCDYRLPANPYLAGIKHLNRLDNIMLQMECSAAGFGDGLVLDNQGNVIETTSSNVFFEQRGKLITPLLNECGVSGVMRGFIIDELAPANQVATAEAVIPLASLDRFSGAFCCNSVRGIIPVERIGDLRFQTTPAMQKLQRSLMESRFEKGQ